MALSWIRRSVLSYTIHPHFPHINFGRRISRTFCEITRKIEIPQDKLEFSYARSSGPGGQNVNKVNSKVEIRFNIKEANWIPEDIRNRLISQQSNKINNDGELIVTSQEHR
jgi:protein subunit release factor B